MREKNSIYAIVTLALMILTWILTNRSPFIIVDIILGGLSIFFPFIDIVINSQNDQDYIWIVVLILGELINNFVNDYLDDDTVEEIAYMWSGNLFTVITITLLQSSLNPFQIENIMLFIFQLVFIIIFVLALYILYIIFFKKNASGFYSILYVMFYTPKVLFWNPIGKGIIFSCSKIIIYAFLTLILLIPAEFIPVSFLKGIWAFAVVLFGYYVMKIASLLVDKLDTHGEDERIIRFSFASFFIIIEVIVLTGHTLPIFIN